MSRQRKELPEIRWCQNDRIFEGFSDFQNKIEFMNCGFLDFWISSFFWISFHIFGTRRATGDPLVSKRPKFLGLYRFTKKLDFLGFWISGFLDFFPFFWISVHIFGNKRATGDPLVSKWPKFLGLYKFTKKGKFFGFLDFWISSFFWISGHIFGNKRATGDPRVSKRPRSFCDCVFGIFLYLCVCICLCICLCVCIFVFLIFSNHHHHHHHHHRLISLPPGQWWLSRFSNELFSNFSRLPEVRFRSPKKGKSSEFNSRDDGIIIWKV